MKKFLLIAIAGVIAGATVGCAPAAEGDTSGATTTNSDAPKPAPTPEAK